MSKRISSPANDTCKKVPDRRVDPLVRKLYSAMKNMKVSYGEVAKESGVGVETLRNYWRQGGNPSLCNFRAVAEVLGFEVYLRPLRIGAHLDIMDKRK